VSIAFHFTTDTSTLCIFDVAALRHRVEEDADWWVHPPNVQVEELNSASAAFIDLGTDGAFSGALSEEQLANPALSFVLLCPSGRFFLGAAEETSSEGMEPDCTRGGLLLSLQPGLYQVSLSRPGSRVLQIGLSPSAAHPSNAFTAPLRLAPGAA
jgi:hypothetical protein